MEGKTKMRRPVIPLIVFTLIILPAAGRAWDRDDPDLGAIRRAIRQECEKKEDSGALGFKILITDRRSPSERVRIRLPALLVERLLESTRKGHSGRGRCGEAPFLLRIYRKLKENAPVALVKIRACDVSVEVWFAGKNHPSNHP